MTTAQPKQLESAWYAAVRTKLPGLWQRIENRIADGTPDACALLDRKIVVIEFKSLAGWSRMLGLRPAQLIWLRRWGLAGGNVWLLARVGSTVLLVHGAHLKVGGCNRAGWLQAAALVYTSDVDWRSMRKLLTGKPALARLST